jgi:hypothetical protein
MNHLLTYLHDKLKKKMSAARYLVQSIVTSAAADRCGNSALASAGGLSARGTERKALWSSMP